MFYIDIAILYLKHVVEPFLEIVAIYVAVYYLFRKIFLAKRKEAKIQRKLDIKNLV